MQKRRSAYLCFIFILHAIVATPSLGLTASVCDQAAKYASEKTGVPFAILRAISWAETGHRNAESKTFGSWPWAVQSMGRGNWLSSREAAVFFVENLIAKGERNIDIGCFQLNFHWHGSAFQNLEAMIMPENNALYAAQFLQKLYHETGDWRIAVGQYHSQDKARAQAYVDRLKSIYNTHIGADSLTVAQNRPVQQDNQAPNPGRFALIKTNGPLVSTQNSARPLIGGRR